MKYLIDTCIISELVKPRPSKKVLGWFDKIEEFDLYLSVLTLGEINKGIQKLDNAKKKSQLKKWLNEDLLVRFEDRILPIDVQVSLKWGEIVGVAASTGVNLPVIDSLLIATARVHEMILVTRNTKHFKLGEVNLLDPF